MTRKTLIALVLATGLAATPALAGSTIGGNPSNGGGQTFGADSVTSVVGATEVAEAVATGDPAAVETALTNAIAANFPGGADSADLGPLPGLTGAQTVQVLVNLIQSFAAAVGLPLSSPAIQQLLQIAQTAAA